MAQTIDYSAGATHYVTIQNKLSAEDKVYFEKDMIDGKMTYDPGDLQNKKILEDAEGKYFIKDNDRWVQLHRINEWVLVKAGDTLKLGVTKSEEVAHYMNLNGDVFTVTVA